MLLGELWHLVVIVALRKQAQRVCVSHRGPGTVPNYIKETLDVLIARAVHRPRAVYIPRIVTVLAHVSCGMRTVSVERLKPVYISDQVLASENTPLGEGFMVLLRVGVPVVSDRDKGERVERGGENMWAVELLGEQDGRCGLGNDVGETALVLLGSIQREGAQRVDLCLLDIVSDERRRPGLSNLLDEAMDCTSNRGAARSLRLYPRASLRAAPHRTLRSERRWRQRRNW